VLLRVAHNSPFSHLSLSHLELRLEQAEDIPAGQEPADRRQHFEDRDKGKVYGHELRPFVKIRGFKGAGVLFEEDDSRVPAQLPIKLVGGHIHGINPAGSLLKKANP